ncbi:glycosyltransferase family 2 protein [Desulfotignum balticum]|uniref:glycosyltransferase family 2 protein n=1 Tax=Desulfotignum balticum TaxID=115781 RepID=UPI00042019F1|nr:glycosyltransferase family 2 protein [Desulfotignum balticum]
MNPAVSIILPTFNRAMSLERSVESVLNQTFTNFEIIIVDDGSVDQTPSVIESLLKKDPRIKAIRFENNLGPAAARNSGIREASGEYVAFQDSDDVWNEKKLEKQCLLLKNLPPDYGFVFSTYQRISGKKSMVLPRRLLNTNTDDLFIRILTKNLVGTPTAIIRKSCIDQSGLMDESLMALEDWEFFIRLSRKFKAKFFKEPLVKVYTDQHNRLSTSGLKLLKARKKILSIHLSEITKKPLILTRHCMKIFMLSLYVFITKLLNRSFFLI